PPDPHAPGRARAGRNRLGTNPPSGRPARHLYRLSKAGVELAAELRTSAVAEVRALDACEIDRVVRTTEIHRCVDVSVDRVDWKVERVAAECCEVRAGQVDEVADDLSLHQHRAVHPARNEV